MNVDAVDQSASRSVVRNGGGYEPDETSGRRGHSAVGKLVEVTVVNKSGPGRYGVRVNGQSHSADSTALLQPGSTVLAVVMAAGAQLELRALSPDEDPQIAQTLATLAARHRVELSGTATRQILAFAGNTDAPAASVRAGLYLQKLGLDVTPDALAALSSVQQPSHDSTASGHEATVIPQTVNSLSHLIEAAIGAPDGSHATGQSGTDTGFDDAKQQGGQPRPKFGGLAQELLALSDGGAVEYQFTSLPLMVGGKLVELDMALFQPRANPATGSPRRLVTSLNTTQLGHLRIVAQSHNEQLNVCLESNSERGVALLSEAGNTMCERLRELGWQVESFRCEHTNGVASAASDIIDHVLTNGSLDRAV